tara:strand:- start:14103 stop:15017 length:915 start_codon:yes stop_codon:yes gene_type:complete
MKDYTFTISNLTQHELLVHAVGRQVEWKSTANTGGQFGTSTLSLDVGSAEEKVYGAAKKQIFRLKSKDNNLIMCEEDTCYLSVFQLRDKGLSEIAIKTNIAVKTTRIKKYIIRDQDVGKHVPPRMHRGVAAGIKTTACHVANKLNGTQQGVFSITGHTAKHCMLDKWTLEPSGSGNNRYYVRGIHGRYLTAMFDGSVMMEDTKDEWQEWTIVVTPAKQVLLRSNLGLYLHRCLNGTISLSQTKSETGTWVIKKYYSQDNYFLESSNIDYLVGEAISVCSNDIGDERNLQSLGNGLVWIARAENP